MTEIFFRSIESKIQKQQYQLAKFHDSFRVVIAIKCMVQIDTQICTKAKTDKKSARKSYQ
jgi:hypothetical protein